MIKLGPLEHETPSGKGKDGELRMYQLRILMKGRLLCRKINSPSEGKLLKRQFFAIGSGFLHRSPQIGGANQDPGALGKW